MIRIWALLICAQARDARQHRLLRSEDLPVSLARDDEPYQMRTYAAVTDSGGVDCSWSDWSAWSFCSTSCGEGTKNRKRWIAVREQGAGAACEGSAEQSEACEGAGNCPLDCAWEPWQDWSQCTASCQGGQKQRTRAVAHFNNTMGKPCDMAEGQQEEECNVGSCNQLSCWSDWTVCSQTCGGGIRARRNKAHCEPQSEEELCNVEACKATPSNATPSEAACVWGDWGSWSSCAMEVSSSCGVSRSLRMQKHGKCSGPALRERSCGTCDCFEQWQSWQACSALCGGGLRTRLRTIRNGTDCHGPLRENVPCNEQGCSCELTDWTGWSPCSGPCQDSKAVSVRTREPVTPGGDCNASMREEMSCDCVEAELAKSTTKPMEAVDCVWANWQDWEVCSASCGMGKTRRTRALALAKNQFGRDCEGEDRQTRECKGDPCPSCETSDWSQWSACTGPCEFSTSRSIRSREPLQQGDCDKSLEEERACSCGKEQSSAGRELS
ncbi:unnamed protein product [Effrenium voratum]|nr:unnamed protein product [Effrenium voratum]